MQKKKRKEKRYNDSHGPMFDITDFSEITIFYCCCYSLLPQIALDMLSKQQSS